MNWSKILYTAVKRNGIKQFFFYLSNLDASRFIELSKTMELLDGNNGFILELGSGYSIFPEIISNSYDGYIPLDLSENACKYQKIKNVNPVLANMCYLPFKSSSIPNIIAISSIEHVPNDYLVYEEISRVLTKNGIAIISVPFTNGEVEIKNIRHSPFLMNLLFKFNIFWRIILGESNYNYFIEQTATDSIMKYYNEKEIRNIIRDNHLEMENEYVFEKGLQQWIWRLVPKGWFVLKDFVIGWSSWKIEEKFLSESKNGKGVIIKIIKLSL